MKRRLGVLLVLLVIAAVGIGFGPGITKSAMKFLYPRQYEELVEREAEEFALDPLLVYAVIRTESGFREKAVSRAGAQGLMQLTPSTFQWIASLYPPENGGQDPFDPSDNIHCGCALLRLLLDQYESLDVALCAYNAGMGNVGGWLSQEQYSSDGESLHTIPYPETDSYVKKVNSALKRYEALYKEGRSP